MQTGTTLPDTSAWVEYLRATGSPADRRIHELLGDSQSIVVTGPIVLEVLAGFDGTRDKRRVRDVLAWCRHAPVQDPIDYEDAAALYAACRAAGSTVRGHIDCLIAAVAIRIGAAVLHRDADFEVIAEHAPLKIA
jgi:predicted nucleic acid-binding protein